MNNFFSLTWDANATASFAEALSVVTAERKFRRLRREFGILVLLPDRLRYTAANLVEIMRFSADYRSAERQRPELMTTDQFRIQNLSFAFDALLMETPPRGAFLSLPVLAFEPHRLVDLHSHVGAVFALRMGSKSKVEMLTLLDPTCLPRSPDPAYF
jgi:hypothetical protein